MTSELLLEKLKEFEGCRLEAYRDAAGVWTIGYGHTFNVRRGDRCSLEWAEELLRKDIEMAERQVLQLNVCYTQAQLDALVSFVFNLGIGKLKGSTLLHCIKRRDTAAIIMKEWRRWRFADGKPLPGLATRRQWEVNRFFQQSEYLNFSNKKPKNHETDKE